MGDRRGRSNSRERRDYGRDDGRDRRDDGRDRRDDGRDRRDGGAPTRDGGRDGPTRDGGATTSLLVRNLSYRVTADEIRRLFTRYGDVRDVYIPQVHYYCNLPQNLFF